MRLIILCLAALLLLIQYPLWLGKGGWLRVWDLDQQVTAAQKKSEDLKARNAKLTSEVQDLKEGTGAVEERARYELGMIKENEIFVQVLEPNGKPAAAQNISKPVKTSNSNSKSQGAMHPEKGLPLTVQKGLPSVVGRQ